VIVGQPDVDEVSRVGAEVKLHVVGRANGPIGGKAAPAAARAAQGERQQERQEELDFNRHGADLVSPITRLGEYWHSFVDTQGRKVGSINEGYQCKLPATLEWTNATATDETDLLVWGVRSAREA
jgi:hypothetical protein